jgi:hypothetical protein
MRLRLTTTVIGVMSLTAWIVAAQPPGHQGCPGCGGHPGRGSMQGMPHQGDPGRLEDMEVFHYLADHGADIRRTVTSLANGVETLTESDVPEVAQQIRVHVASMAARVEARRPIHQRDPLFAELFKHAGKIAFSHEPTEKGVRVVETSTDPYVARLIQAHAEVVSLFVKNGRAEMMRNHELPRP